MPLRDHFRPPLDNAHSWEELHGQWPAVIVQHLRKRLPAGYVAAPRLHSGTELPDCDNYEVRIFDAKRGRHLVAAVEIVSPANKDRPEHRNVFIAKCVELLRAGMAVNIVDLVTILPFNLYVELFAFIGHNDPTLGAEPGGLYAASCRRVKKREKPILEAWSHVLAIGQSLPTLPLWLAENLAVPLDLEQSYEQACHDLWIA